MTKLSVLWIGLISLLVTMLLFLFHGNVFAECYGLNASLLTLGISSLSPFTNCLLYTGVTVFGILFLGPVLVTLSIYAIYIVIFDRPMQSSNYLLWLIWFILLYFVVFQINLLPAI